ncbi:MAG: hypothetical protein LBS86_02225 [Treponema sp.]|nr:hypothetical protein [Treponema sp.]
MLRHTVAVLRHTVAEPVEATIITVLSVGAAPSTSSAAGSTGIAITTATAMG